MDKLVEIASSNIKNDDLVTEVLYKIEPNFFKALDIVSEIVEIRSLQKMVKVIRSRGWVGDIDTMISKLDVKDPGQFKLKVLHEVEDVPLRSESYLWDKCCLCFPPCLRLSGRTL